MNRTLTIGLVQQANTTDAETNRQRLAEAVARVADQGARLVEHQELRDTPYFC